MKQDPIFRDAAHHFLRRFDHIIADFEPEVSDAELTTLGETRTARAFMLVGRVATLLHKPADGGSFAYPGRTYHTASVMGMPSAV